MKKRLQIITIASIAMFAVATAWAAGPIAVILNDPGLPGADAGYIKRVGAAVAASGYEVKPETVDELLAPSALSSNSCKLLVLPQARALPVELNVAMQPYLKSGGHLIVIGAPAWDTPLVRDDSDPSGKRWVTPDANASRRGLEAPTHPVVLFDRGVADWVRSSDHSESPANAETVAVDANGRTSNALHVRISNLQGWDTLESPTFAATPFPAGQTTTVFSAKGDPRTRALAVEWEERDGSRWIATIPLTNKWQWYALAPSAFRSWSNSQSRAALGFRPENAAHIKIGLAFTHTGSMGGAHEYWISSVGTSSERGTDPSVDDNHVTPLDTVSPRYKFFDIHGNVSLQADASQILTDFGPTVLTSGMASSSPRPSGAGFNKGRSWRWIPLLKATDSVTGEWRGSPATLMLHGPGDAYADSAWLAIAGNSASYLTSPETLRLITDTALRMKDGLFFLESGSEFYTVEPGQTVRLGARIINVSPTGSTDRGGEVQIVVADHAGHVVWSHKWTSNVPPGTAVSAEATWQPPSNWPTDGYIVTSELLEAGKVVDRLTNDLNVYTVSSDGHRDFVKAGPDGHFYKDGKLWRINGVNYMPSSGIAQEDGGLFERWMSRAAYDPVVIERDLGHIVALGMNAVNIFIYRDDLDSQNLIDMLRRCRNHHLMVYLSLRPGILDFLHSNSKQPLADAYDNFTTIIKRFHLDQDDTIFAYETAWEPNFGDQAERRIMDAAWSAWVQTHYGRVANAEMAWGCAAPRDAAGKLTNPPSSAVSGEDAGAYKLAIAYRRFLDDWLKETYGNATFAIHAVAPNQLVSFRMASTGYPQDDQRSALPYQFEGLKTAVDFFAPECYGRVGSADGELGIQFEAAYARSVAPNLPVIWDEVGFTAWDTGSQTDDPAALEFQGKYFDTFYKLARKFGVDGIFWWWYPGGFRVGENSDFGIINPDGTPRASTEAIGKNGAAFLGDPIPPAPNVVLEYNREKHASGIHGVFEQLKAPFDAALRNGDRPGLKPTNN